MIPRNFIFTILIAISIKSLRKCGSFYFFIENIFFGKDFDLKK